MGPDVSVCVASYRRPAGLVRLLESLARQKLPERLGLEVIVVDNDAEGSAAPVLERFRGSLPLRGLREPRRNIAHARNRALDAARGQWIAFIDDDEAADEDWLAAYWKRAEAGDADGQFGPVLPRLERPGRRWLAPDRFYSRPRFATGTALGPENLASCNAFLRRKLFDGQRFDPAFGRSGASDSELFGRLLRGGARFVWCDEARVCEFIPPERHRLAWLAQRAFRGGVAFTRLERLSAASGVAWRTAPRAVAGLLLCVAGAPLSLLGGRAPAARLVLRACTQLGHLWALLGGSYEEYGAR